jgi:hypothetical protein
VASSAPPTNKTPTTVIPGSHLKPNLNLVIQNLRSTLDSQELELEEPRWEEEEEFPLRESHLNLNANPPSST